MSAKTCDSCRFWVRLGEGNVGDCRKYAPRLVREGHPFNMRIWPNTYDIDWCDEFKEEKALKAEKKKKDKEELVIEAEAPETEE